MRVRVDPLVCEANGVCVGLAPEVFDLNDDDELEILKPDVPAEEADRVRHAVRSCPKAALTLEE
ncbi:ferredoxin [Spirillospora sp. NPDC000708]|jgi:ferredoxin|uniref:Ferredoxin n=3 Tax=Actinomadura TaxID=1988 RepID=A0A6I4MUP4_9ACTN|nr:MULTISPECIES: ferredoxin [Actinomadura]MBD2891931.1 Ferredoxin [Actinomadura sp. RB99]MBO2441061.1 ferredoxin [Actinomadura nitritigenes]MWA06359.1 ferredoxin [Actinomadura physcomitrii]QKG25773.1 putative ferredoxin [Actinomadura verrucosospora]